MEELLVLVDERDRPLGTAPKLAVHRAGTLHRAFSVMLFDRAGRILLQRRARSKYHSGGLWSNTCCGHPRPDEPLTTAARRRLSEEMGVSCQLRPIGAFVYRARIGDLEEHEYDHVLVGRFDGAPRPAASEVEEWRWVDPAAAAAELAAAPERFTVWFGRVLEVVRLWSPASPSPGRP
jgi:isopentenyl-diphosphate delta-isomerase